MLGALKDRATQWIERDCGCEADLAIGLRPHSVSGAFLFVALSVVSFMLEGVPPTRAEVARSSCLLKGYSVFTKGCRVLLSPVRLRMSRP